MARASDLCVPRFPGQGEPTACFRQGGCALSGRKQSVIERHSTPSRSRPRRLVTSLTWGEISKHLKRFIVAGEKKWRSRGRWFSPALISSGMSVMPVMVLWSLGLLCFHFKCVTNCNIVDAMGENTDPTFPHSLTRVSVPVCCIQVVTPLEHGEPREVSLRSRVNGKTAQHQSLPIVPVDRHPGV